MTLAYLENETRSFFGKNRIKKEILKIRSDLMLDFAKEHGEMGQKVLYDEYYNTARLYMGLCEEDKSYSSILLGLGRMKPAKLIAKIAADLYHVSCEIPRTIGMEEELKVFIKYFGHLMRRVDLLEKTLMLGGIGGRRRRG